jgi:hygromycin-B 4-O-kinase
MEQEKLRDSVVRDFLAAHIGSVPDLSPVGLGEWSYAYAVDCADGERVIRFSQFQQDFLKDRMAYKFDSDELPVPKILEIGGGLDGFYAISERAHGTPIDNLSQADMQRLTPAFWRMLDAVRVADVSDSKGYGPWGPTGDAGFAAWREYLLSVGDERPRQGIGGWENRILGWRSKLMAFPLRQRAFDEALAHLSRLVEGCPEERYLVHSDLLNHNLLATDAEITAVLDWGSSTYGDFLYDLAWFTFWSAWNPELAGVDFRQEALRHYGAIGLNVPDFELRLRCYEVHIGLESQVYNAFKERWDFVDEVATRTLQLAKAKL